MMEYENIQISKKKERRRLRSDWLLIKVPTYPHTHTHTHKGMYESQQEFPSYGRVSTLEPVEKVMSKYVFTVQISQTAYHAAKLMSDKNVGILPVMNGDELMGMVTDRDLTVKVLGKQRDSTTPLSVIVADNAPYVVYPDDSIEYATEKMMKFGVRRLPVVRRNTGKLVGILSLDDLALNIAFRKTGRILAAVAAEPVREPRKVEDDQYDSTSVGGFR